LTLWSVILAGGVGSRFWPLSTRQRPKQLLPLSGTQPLLVDTVSRLTPLVAPEHTLIITNADLAASVVRLLPGVPRDNIIAEPRSAGTGPALAWAAVEVERRDGRDAAMLCVHADWSIADADRFRAVLGQAAQVAGAYESLVTVGIVPERPDPGFGYIEPGPPVNGARRVTSFTEKPDRAAAERMVREGFLWNSGIFAWRAGDFLDEIRKHTPEIAPSLRQAERADLAGFFAGVTPITVDHGVLERSDRVLVIPGDFGWDDVGTWAALRRVRARDARGNASAGRVHAIDATDNVTYAEGPTVVLYGVSDLVVVALGDLTLVTTVDRAADLKRLVDSLPADVRERA
jgi:mannose-1-phosphate guanylyltransferase